MSLPNRIDKGILERFDSLIKDGEALVNNSANSGTSYISFSTSAKSLFRFVLEELRYKEIQQEIQMLEMRSPGRGAPSSVLEILRGLKADYESGVLDDLSQMIEATVSYDFMGQAEQLLDGEKPDYDHIPAAVLAGAVLENGLRRLCQRQSPPIETKWNDGKHKRLNKLIDELQGKAFNPAKADQLRSWAKTRNSAGHGEFDDFTRADVEDMIPGIKRFLAEYDL